MKHVLAVLMMLALYMGCGSVPDVVFVRDGDDGGSDGGAPATEAGPIDDTGVAPDAGPPTCGGREFPPGSTCCGEEVLCFGSCGSGKCKQDCQSKGCAAPQVCCRKQTGPGANDTTMTCVATAADCQ